MRKKHLLDSIRRWVRFNLLYLSRPRWDTGISPPELSAVIEGESALAPGTALDLGCGTGTNVIYMARYGWKVSGIDFIPTALLIAYRKAWAERVRAHFYLGSVANMFMFKNPFDLILDMGCFHGLSQVDRWRYVTEVTRLSHSGTLFLLYAMEPLQNGAGPTGVAREEVKALFTPFFQIEHFQVGTDTGNGRTSIWYTLRRH